MGEGIGVGVGEDEDLGVGVGTGVGDGDERGVGVGVDFGLGVGVDSGAGAGMTVSLGVEEGVDSGGGDVAFFGDGVLLGVAAFAAFTGVGVATLRDPEDDDFNFGVAVGLGAGVCALRSTPRWAPRFARLAAGAGVPERLILNGGKNDFLGVGVGVGLGAALSDSAKPRSNTDFSQKVLPLMIQLRVLSKAWSFQATVKLFAKNS